MGQNRIVGAAYQQQEKTGDFTTSFGTDLYLVNAPTGAPVTVTLDPNAVQGDRVAIQDSSGDADTQPISIVVSDGQTILGQGSSLSIATAYGRVDLTFNDAIGGWTAVISSESSGGSGVLPNPSWSQADWYVDWTNGQDSNPGTQAKPVKTVMGGVVARWGTRSPTLTQSTTIHVVTPQPLNAEYIVLQPVLANGGRLDVIVTPQPVGSPFAAGTVTAKTRGAPGNSLSVTGFTGAGVSALQLVHNTTHDSWGSIDSIADGTATMCQPFDSAGLFTVSAEPDWNEENGWAHNDELQVYAQGLLNLKVFQPFGGDSNTSFTAGVCSVQNAYIPDVSGVAGDSAITFEPQGAGVILINCRFDPFLTLVGVGEAFLCAAVNCVANGGFALSDAQFIGGSGNTSGNEFNETVSGINTIDGDAILHGAGADTVALSVHGGGYVIMGFVQFPDASTTIALAHGGYALLEPGAITSPTGCQVWGESGMNTEGVSHCELAPVVGQTWTACLTLVGGQSIEAVTTGAKYVPGAPGVFTDGIALNTTNLDTFHGLTSPLKGGAGYIGG
jgi:hypothetical protein